MLPSTNNRGLHLAPRPLHHDGVRHVLPPLLLHHLGNGAMVQWCNGAMLQLSISAMLQYLMVEWWNGATGADLGGDHVELELGPELLVADVDWPDLLRPRRPPAARLPVRPRRLHTPRMVYCIH